jgi:hypothetical protein
MSTDDDPQFHIWTLADLPGLISNSVIRRYREKMYIATKHVGRLVDDILESLGDYILSIYRTPSEVFLTSDFRGVNRSSASNRYANVFLHPASNVGLVRARALVPSKYGPPASGVSDMRADGNPNCTAASDKLSIRRAGFPRSADHTVASWTAMSSADSQL